MCFPFSLNQYREQQRIHQGPHGRCSTVVRVSYSHSFQKNSRYATMFEFIFYSSTARFVSSLTSRHYNRPQWPSFPSGRAFLLPLSIHMCTYPNASFFWRHNLGVQLILVMHAYIHCSGILNCFFRHICCSLETNRSTYSFATFKVGVVVSFAVSF